MPALAQIADAPALWGFLGAVIYAAPRLSVCLFSKEPGAKALRCLIEAVTALMIGAIAAAAFSEWIIRFLHLAQILDLRAVAATIGALATPTAPAIINALSGGLMARYFGEKKP